jgi:hypothetical protein
LSSPEDSRRCALTDRGGVARRGLEPFAEGQKAVRLELQ